MAWSLWQPSKPTNVVPTLVSGGSLAANTTYYVRVQAFDTLSATKIVPQIQAHPHIYSPYSDVVQIATTDTHKSIALTWNKVYKQDGLTEVDAYEVLVATSPAQFDQEHAVICRSGGYTTPATYTNSYTVTATPTLAYHRIPDGVPNLKWDGVGTATIEGLYDWLIANGYSRFVSALSTPGGTTPRTVYHIVGRLEILPETGGGYAFQMEYREVTIFGGLYVANCRVNWKNSVLNIMHMSHGGGIDLSVNAAGSTIEGVTLWNGFGKSGEVIYADASRSWRRYIPQKPPVGPYEAFRTNLFSYGQNVNLDLLVSQPVLRPDGSGGIRSSVSWKAVMSNLVAGQHLMSSEHIWNPGNPSLCMELVNNYEYWQFPHCSFVDCVTNAANYQNKTGVLFDRRVQFSGGYGKDYGNRVTPLFRRFRIIALDQNSAPLAGAKVSLWGAGGQNLTLGNTEGDLTRLCAWSANPARNWERAEQTIKHTDTDIWLVRNEYYGSAVPVPGQTYWMHAERLRLVEQLQTDGAWEKWRTERGLTNTVIGWAVAWPPLIAAPDYHLTDAAGEVWNITALMAYKHAYDNPDKICWLSEVPANVGSLTYYTPITVRVEADGYEIWEATYDLSVLESTGVKPFVVVAQLEPAEPPVIVEQRVALTLAEITSATLELVEQSADLALAGVPTTTLEVGQQ